MIIYKIFNFTMNVNDLGLKNSKLNSKSFKKENPANLQKANENQANLYHKLFLFFLSFAATGMIIIISKNKKNEKELYIYDPLKLSESNQSIKDFLKDYQDIKKNITSKKEIGELLSTNTELKFLSYNDQTKEYQINNLNNNDAEFIEKNKQNQEDFFSFLKQELLPTQKSNSNFEQPQIISAEDQENEKRKKAQKEKAIQITTQSNQLDKKNKEIFNNNLINSKKISENPNNNQTKLTNNQTNSKKISDNQKQNSKNSKEISENSKENITKLNQNQINSNQNQINSNQKLSIENQSNREKNLEYINEDQKKPQQEIDIENIAQKHIENKKIPRPLRKKLNQALSNYKSSKENINYKKELEKYLSLITSFNLNNTNFENYEKNYKTQENQKEIENIKILREKLSEENYLEENLDNFIKACSNFEKKLESKDQNRKIINQKYIEEQKKVKNNMQNLISEIMTSEQYHYKEYDEITKQKIQKILNSIKENEKDSHIDPNQLEQDLIFLNENIKLIELQIIAGKKHQKRQEDRKKRQDENNLAIDKLEIDLKNLAKEIEGNEFNNENYEKNQALYSQYRNIFLNNSDLYYNEEETNMQKTKNKLIFSLLLENDNMLKKQAEDKNIKEELNKQMEKKLEKMAQIDELEIKLQNLAQKISKISNNQENQHIKEYINENDKLAKEYNKIFDGSLYLPKEEYDKKSDLTFNLLKKNQADIEKQRINNANELLVRLEKESSEINNILTKNSYSLNGLIAKYKKLEDEIKTAQENKTMNTEILDSIIDKINIDIEKIKKKQEKINENKREEQLAKFFKNIATNQETENLINQKQNPFEKMTELNQLIFDINNEYADSKNEKAKSYSAEITNRINEQIKNLSNEESVKKEIMEIVNKINQKIEKNYKIAKEAQTKYQNLAKSHEKNMAESQNRDQQIQLWIKFSEEEQKIKYIPLYEIANIKDEIEKNKKYFDNIDSNIAKEMFEEIKEIEKEINQYENQKEEFSQKNKRENIKFDEKDYENTKYTQIKINYKAQIEAINNMEKKFNKMEDEINQIIEIWKSTINSFNHEKTEQKKKFYYDVLTNNIKKLEEQINYLDKEINKSLEIPTLYENHESFAKKTEIEKKINEIKTQYNQIKIQYNQIKTVEPKK